MRLKTKYLILPTYLLPLLLLLLKIKYLITVNISLLENLPAGHFQARLAQANLASQNDIVNFAKKTDFDDKLKSLNKKVTSNKKNMYLLKMN